MYYLVLFLILAILAFLDTIISDKRAKMLLLAMAYLLLLFTSGFRYETGVDWRAYTYMVDDVMPIDKINTLNGYESIFSGLNIGFNLLISVIKYFGGGVQTLFFITSLISTSFLTISLRRYLRYPVFGLLLYYGMAYFYLDMSGLRQALSLSIFLFSLQYIYQRKPFKYIFFLAIALTFHWSSIFLFPLYWVIRLRVNKVVVGFLLSIAVILYLLGTKWMTSLIPQLFSALQNTNLATKIIIYSTTEIFASDRGINARNVIHVFLLLFTLFISIRYKDRLTAQNKYYPIFHKLLVIQVFVYFIFYEFPEIAERIKLYFYVANLIVLPSFLLIIHRYYFKIGLSSFLFVYSLFYGNVHILEKPYAIAYSPYQNYLIYRFFDLHSTGEQRLNQHIANVEATGK